MTIARTKARLIKAAERYVEHAVHLAERRGSPMSRADAEAIHKTCFRLPAAIMVPDLAELDEVMDTSDLQTLDYKCFSDASHATLADAEKHCALQRREIEVWHEGELLNRVNPQAYFTDLLTRLVNG